MEKESSSAEALAFGHGIEKLVDSSDTTSQVDKAEKKDEVKQKDDFACINNKVDKAEKKDEVKQEDDFACTNIKVSEKTKDNTPETLMAEAIKKEKDNSLICVSPSGIVTLNRKMLVDLDMTAAECDKPKIDVSADGVVKLNQEWVTEDMKKFVKSLSKK